MGGDEKPATGPEMNPDRNQKERSMKKSAIKKQTAAAPVTESPAPAPETTAPAQPQAAAPAAHAGSGLKSGITFLWNMKRPRRTAINT